LTTKSSARIKLLDQRLANQIAAGEVVERPASVVKELIENSIDAGASRIEVSIERGGTRSIQISDDGRGIAKDDLALALTRHATSKIHTSEDLAAIRSLGFRGEALASISAVSRLSLTSRPHDCQTAWQASAQGRDMAVQIQPAAAAAGTRINVSDLFFNTPARQKFLRTEKTEFAHVETVFKRLALANFSTAFVLKHNHKVVKRVPACADESQHFQRIAAICGRPFIDNCVTFSCQHELIQLQGWLGLPHFHRSESDLQYVFINSRPVKDKTLNHAIRQSYEGLLPPGRVATYVIFLTLDPAQVDVNVHPTKHEVRFGQQRLVHDLLARSIGEALADSGRLVPQIDEPHPVISADEVPGAHDDSQNLWQVQQGRTVAESTRHAYAFEGQANSRANPAPRGDRENGYAEIAQAGAESSEIKNAGTSTAASETVGHEADTINRVQARLRTPAYLSDLQLPPLIRYDQSLWLSELEGQAVVVHGARLLAHFVDQMLCGEIIADSIPLLFPRDLALAPEKLEDVQTFERLGHLGFVVEPASDNRLSIRKTPLWLSSVGSEHIFKLLPQWLEESDESMMQLIGVQLGNNSASLASYILAQLSYSALPEKICRALPQQLLEGVFDDS